MPIKEAVADKEDIRTWGDVWRVVNEDVGSPDSTFLSRSVSALGRWSERSKAERKPVIPLRIIVAVRGPRSKRLQRVAERVCLRTERSVFMALRDRRERDAVGVNSGCCKSRNVICFMLKG